ncbi:MAG: Dna2/Cas4 domain-containing protein [Thermoproteota archaeon]|nr:Dna2/Cas4 domain-containing protein [Thermoproteota archaeon]
MNDLVQKITSDVQEVKETTDLFNTRDEDADTDYIALMRETMEEWYSRPRKGWHVTDIALCPRQRVFKAIDPLPLTDKELNMYSSGKAVHEAVQWLFMSNPGRYEKEKYVEYNDIEGSIDVFDKKRNTPIEFKTLRSSNIDKPKSFQEEQLRYYMAMQNSPIGYMIYQCIMHFGDSPWREFKVTMTEQQRKDQLEKLVREMTSLQNAMKAKDPSLARNVYLDKDLNWLCKECPYGKECETMRAAGAAA